MDFYLHILDQLPLSMRGIPIAFQGVHHEVTAGEDHVRPLFLGMQETCFQTDRRAPFVKDVEVGEVSDAEGGRHHSTINEATLAAPPEDGVEPPSGYALVVFGSILGLGLVASLTPGLRLRHAAKPTTPGLQICDRLRGRWLASLAVLGEEIVVTIVGRGGLYRDIRELGVSRYVPPRPTIG